MEERTAILANFEKYGFTEAVVGFVEPSSTFTKGKSLFLLGDGRSRDVDNEDFFEIELSIQQKQRIFPFCY